MNPSLPGDIPLKISKSPSTGFWKNATTVGSLVVFPSVSSPSSDTSVIVLPEGVVAVADAVFDTPPALSACALTMKVAV